MVYGASWCPTSSEQSLRDDYGVNDSKQLTDERRKSILTKLTANSPDVKTCVCVLSPTYLSAEMLAVDRLSLNDLSFAAAFRLLRRILEAGYPVSQVFVDTVGDPEKYRQKWLTAFPEHPNIEFTVSKKADSLFPIVGAASISAKVVRDTVVDHWPFIEPSLQQLQQSGEAVAMGSGYPGDPATKSWLVKHMDYVFGFPSAVRFSWATAKTLMESKEAGQLRACVFEWGDEDQYVTSEWTEDQAADDESGSTAKPRNPQAGKKRDREAEKNQPKLSFQANPSAKQAVSSKDALRSRLKVTSLFDASMAASTS
jgi:ribonuclease H2 subunit A